MAAWWLLAEATFALALEWAERRMASRHPVVLVSARGAPVLALVVAGVALLAFRLNGGSADVPMADLAAGEAWNALCTIWVMLEAAVLYFLARIVLGLEGPQRHASATVRRAALLIPAGAVCVVAVAYPAWHAAIRELVAAGGLDAGDGADRLQLLYIRLCGACWVAIEAACAWWLWRARALFLARGL
jgi:hypothetical protein